MESLRWPLEIEAMKRQNVWLRVRCLSRAERADRKDYLTMEGYTPSSTVTSEGGTHSEQQNYSEIRADHMIVEPWDVIIFQRFCIIYTIVVLPWFQFTRRLLLFCGAKRERRKGILWNKHSVRIYVRRFWDSGVFVSCSKVQKEGASCQWLINKSLRSLPSPSPPSFLFIFFYPPARFLQSPMRSRRDLYAKSEMERGTRLCICLRTGTHEFYFCRWKLGEKLPEIE